MVNPADTHRNPASGPPDVPRIGRYIVTAELGRGGMGVVSRAFDPQLQRDVAIKMIIDPLAVGDDERARFLREARAAARLRHEAMVAVHEVGEHQGRPYLVMDFIDGETLEAALARDAIEPRRLAEILRDVARALQVAHDVGIVHRDVKPQNVLLDRAGRPHLADFGLARDASAQDQLTVTGQLVGTPAYMAPEQAEADASRHGPTVDVYALGAVLYRGIVGRPPFEASDQIRMLKKVLFDDPVAPRSIRPNVHPDLETIALRCLEKEAGRRYGSAGSVADELDRFIRGDAIEARPAGRGARARRWVQRRKAVTALGVVLGLVVLTGPVVAIDQARRAREAELARLVLEARTETRARIDAAWAIAERGADGNDEALAAAIEGLEASARLDHLARLAGSDAAAERHEAAMALGELALRARQWTVAKRAFTIAEATGVAAADARGGIARADAARTERSERRRALVDSIMNDGRRGRLATEAASVEAIDTLLREGGDEAIESAIRELDAFSATLAAVRRETYLEGTAEVLRPRIAAPIERAELVAALESTEPGSSLERDERSWKVLARAEERVVLAARAACDPEAGGFRRITFPALLRTRQEGALPGGDAIARLCCDFLGRARSDEAVESLARLLAVAADPRLRVRAARALCRIGGEGALRIVLAARRRDGIEGVLEANTGDLLRLPSLGLAWDDDGPDATLDRAEIHLVRGELDTALAMVRQALDRQPDRADSWALAGRIHVGRERASEALQAFERAVSLDPEDASSWAWVARSRMELGDLAGADRALAGAFRSALDPMAFWVRGVLRERAGDIPGANRDYVRALELRPTFSKARAQIVGTATGGPSRNLAVAYAESARLVENNPGVPAAWIQRAGVLLATGGGPLEVLSDAERALELEPGLASALAMRGEALRRTGDLAGAIRVLRRALELDPEQQRYRLSLVEALLDALEPEAALPEADRLVRTDPSFPDGWRFRGLTLLRLGRFREAIPDLTRSIELQPGLASSWLWRARCLKALGDPARALADLEEAVAREPRSTMPWLYLGRELHARGQLDRAQDALQKAVGFAVDDPHARVALGTLLIDRGRLADAELELSRAIELDPLEGGTRLERGRLRAIVVERGLAGPDLLDLAIEDLGRGVDLAPHHPNARAAIEMIRALQGSRRR